MHLAFFDYFFFLLFNLSVMVGFLFWSLFFYDRELVLPAHMDAIYPWPLNLYQHGVVALIVWADLSFFYHPHRTISKNLMIVIAFSLFYIAWLHICFQFNREFPYPILNKIQDFNGHLIFYLVTISIELVVAFISIYLFHLRGKFAGAPELPKEKKLKK
eukprot:TRINITY_DN11825_c0_g1_i1.p2 TRINITY_DN11825_c0_g1~~TRINITY_DN11825_c0_g1_i1.p2  ORF type:complete len:159 (-),score=39.77 TRINITY_DN11825_c0_g1_i1:150-626(-)